MAELPMMGGMPGAGAGPAAAPPVAPASPGPTGPTASPMATPQANEGLQRAARIQVLVAVKSLQQTLPAFPFDSEEFKSLSEALKKIGDAFGKSEADDSPMVPAEIMSMLANVTGQSPGQAQMAQQPAMAGA